MSEGKRISVKEMEKGELVYSIEFKEGKRSEEEIHLREGETVI